MIPYAGEIAALATAFCWSWTAIFFTAAGRRIGFASVNLIRLTGAVILLFITSRLMLEGSVADWFEGGNVFYLILSGLIGLALGDNALFSAMIRFGPRRATLVMACVPIITSLLALFFLGERLAFIAWTGIIITVGGVAWVVLEKEPPKPSDKIADPKQLRTGIILGLVAALCQAVGLILTKAGMGETVNPVAATFLRMVAGWAGIALSFSIGRRWKDLAVAFHDNRAMLLTGAGTIVGPFIGVWLSLVSVKYAETGVAATLMGTTPIIVIPWAYFIFKEQVSARTWIGTIAAVAGTALIFQR